jgi:hypothetical protein
MRVEAIRRDEGILIPFVEGFANIKGDHVLLDIEMASEPSGDDYSDLESIIGMCSTGHKDGSMRHDEVIYRKEDAK